MSWPKPNIGSMGRHFSARCPAVRRRWRTPWPGIGRRGFAMATIWGPHKLPAPWTRWIAAQSPGFMRTISPKNNWTARFSMSLMRTIALPCHYWGSGHHVAADGTKWDLYEQNLLSDCHIRYGGYGGIGYYHARVSNNANTMTISFVLRRLCPI